ncbi:MAG: hypothetical protein Q4G14_12955 [Paracoccus sp. (in: a-proteobacteria)]|uniref:hypothetical protein n=1 Tax=Paracoccus sp. TaxID=267 RepID=UPI0026DF09D5|nr:hypothetical protein [Paracoccus sp. (in: a-proteobacteria)]MDO5614132.1 hypothetical protein [Paracoccus sp. (in: a-proteobacteria)]
MRFWAMMAAAAVAVAGCSINEGVNPNYQMGDAGRYDEYRRDREVALVTGAEPPRTVPVARPFDAPTADDIMWKPAPRQAAATVAATTQAPAAQTGRYGGATPVLTRFAFAAQHAPGTRVWARPAGGTAAQAARACAPFANADQAQVAFLTAGGPEADPRGMDPDGDGFVCGWNPAPWRQAPL